jgi:membrane protein
LLSIILIPVIEVVQNLTSQIWFLSTLEFGFLKYLFLSLITFSIIFGVFYFIYYVVPFRKRKKRGLFVSALWATLLWELAKQLFGLYVSYSANLSRVYGAYVFIVAVILWLYYSSVVVIVGAEIGQLYIDRLSEKKKTDNRGSDENKK